MRLPVALFVFSAILPAAVGQPPGDLIPKAARAKIVDRLGKEYAEVKAGRAKYAADLKKATMRLEGAKAGRVNTSLSKIASVESKTKITYTFPSEAEKKRVIETFGQSVENYKKLLAGPDPAKPEEYGEPIGTPEVGGFGVIRSPLRTAHIGRVLGSQTLTATIVYPSIPQARIAPARVLVSGLDTSKMADGVGVLPEGLYYVRGTKFEEGRTMFELIPFVPTAEERAAIAGAKP